jgi:hypothetical protein
MVGIWLPMEAACSGASFETISVTRLHAMIAMAMNSTLFLFDLHEEWVIRVVMLGKIFCGEDRADDEGHNVYTLVVFYRCRSIWEVLLVGPLLGP